MVQTTLGLSERCPLQNKCGCPGSRLKVVKRSSNLDALTILSVEPRFSQVHGYLARKNTKLRTNTRYGPFSTCRSVPRSIQEYLAHTKTPTLKGPFRTLGTGLR